MRKAGGLGPNFPRLEIIIFWYKWV